MPRQYQDGDSAWKIHFMINRWSFYIGIVMIVGFISSAFKPLESLNHNWFYVSENEELLYQFPSEKPSDYINIKIPFTGKYFIGFKEAVAFKESQGRYNMINSLGYLGKYQFGTSALRFIGINNNAAFLSNPALQEKAFVALLKINKSKLKDVIEEYRGKTIDGVRITESGILAAAHLGGAGSVRKYLESNG
ncbi:MAG: peptidoglycan-binding protein LysM, partial [Flavobacteriaceae bacterium]|nr:peptidoglycan-binding protein LysM [Flavobacteriaceae bacterium]